MRKKTLRLIELVIVIIVAAAILLNQFAVLEKTGKTTQICSSDKDCTAEPDKIGVCEDSKCVYENPVEVGLIIINDKNCKTCDTSNILMTTKQLFLGLKEKEIDVSSNEAKKLVEELGLTVLPAFIFDESVTETHSWKNFPELKTAFEKVKDKYMLSNKVTGASYFIDEEARQEHYESIGVTLGDNKPQIDFFVMAHCPYGNLAEEAIKPAFDILGDKAEFNPHYVIYSDYKGGGPDYCLEDYCSMHGIQELNQGIRELCVNKYFGIAKWFDFALAINKRCNYNNVDKCWMSAAKSLGLDTEKISKCEKEEAIELLKPEKELNDILGVSGSPTVFIEGEMYQGPRTPQGYLDALCNSFDEKPEECNEKLSSSGAATPTGSC